jgi:hypothetical protein
MVRSGFVINFAETAGQGIWIQGWMLLLVNNIYREKKKSTNIWSQIPN